MLFVGITCTSNYKHQFVYVGTHICIQRNAAPIIINILLLFRANSLSLSSFPPCSFRSLPALPSAPPALYSPGWADPSRSCVDLGGFPALTLTRAAKTTYRNHLNIPCFLGFWKGLDSIGLGSPTAPFQKVARLPESTLAAFLCILVCSSVVIVCTTTYIPPRTKNHPDAWHIGSSRGGGQ